MGNNMQFEHLLQIKITYLTFLFQAYYCCSYVGCVLCLAGFRLGQYLKLNALLSRIVFPNCCALLFNVNGGVLTVIQVSPWRCHVVTVLP